MLRRLICALPLLASCIACASPSLAQTSSSPSATVAANAPVTSAGFDASAGPALQAMKARAEQLKVGGVAVLAYFEGDRVESWTSKMLVVGRLKDNPSATDKGANLLGIAYAKAAEMADTLKDSGSKVRPPMTGEFGWEGGVIVRVKTGYVIAAFSGGESADDVAVARAGAAKVLEELKLPK